MIAYFLLPAARNDDSILRYSTEMFFTGLNVDDRSASCNNGSRTYDRVFLDNASFIYSATAAHKRPVLNDYRSTVGWFEHATDDGAGADVHVFSYLRAGADKHQ